APGEMSAVFLPVQEVADALDDGFEQSWKSCGRLPLSVTVNVIAPCAAVFGTSVKANSLVLLIDTLIDVAFLALVPAKEGIAATRAMTPAIAATARSRLWRSCMEPPELVLTTIVALTRMGYVWADGRVG